MARIVGILLAAGEGARFGGDKLLAPIAAPAAHGTADTPLGVVAARNLIDAVPDCIAVVRPRDATLAAHFAAAGLRVVPCAHADEGMGVTLACGIAASSDADGWIIALGDMPWIASKTIRAVADTVASGADIVAPSYRGQRGHPIGFSHRHLDALRALTGDAGARPLIERNRDRLTWIDVDDAGVLRDVDTRSDLNPVR
jgi:molybdenum cofactor cytidylyltransferase